MATSSDTSDIEAARWLRFFWPVLSVALTSIVVPGVGTITKLQTTVEVLTVQLSVQQASIENARLGCREGDTRLQERIEVLERRAEGAAERLEALRRCPPLLRCVPQ